FVRYGSQILMEIRRAGIAFSIAFHPLKQIKSLKIKEHALLHHWGVRRKVVLFHAFSILVPASPATDPVAGSPWRILIKRARIAKPPARHYAGSGNQLDH